MGAGGFADGARELKYLIHPSEKSLGRDITQFNEMRETEVLFRPATKFEVVKIYTQKLKHLTNKDIMKETLIVELKEHSAT